MVAFGFRSLTLNRGLSPVDTWNAMTQPRTIGKVFMSAAYHGRNQVCDCRG